mmetsp:Transcript_24429/g.96937  ORF Transcript_24429/g.96937 Transcript_24429/m.96937 type:complete len:207 (-) Transcript_24429:3413-4033(-)
MHFELASQEDVETLVVLLAAGTANAPHQREGEECLDVFDNRGDFIGFGQVTTLQLIERFEVATEESRQRLYQIVVYSLDELTGTASYECDGGVSVHVKKKDQFLFQVGFFELRHLRQHRCQPCFNKRLQAQRFWLLENDPNTTYCCRRRDHQVLDLKHHSHLVRHFYGLPGDQTQLLVVIKDGVHVLDPDGINGPVEHDPLSVRRC